MNLDQLNLITRTLLPLIGDAGNLLARLIAGGVGMTTAKAEIRGILAVALDRLTAADAEFEARDAAENKRLADLTSTKP